MLRVLRDRSAVASIPHHSGVSMARKRWYKCGRQSLAMTAGCRRTAQLIQPHGVLRGPFALMRGCQMGSALRWCARGRGPEGMCCQLCVARSGKDRKSTRTRAWPQGHVPGVGT